MGKRRAEIWILTGPIRRGKTTRLMRFCSENSGCGGFLSPDREEKRWLYFPRTTLWEAFESTLEKDVIQIGRFGFLKESFEKATKEVWRGIQEKLPYIIIDEIGKLEIEQGLGFDGLAKQLMAMEISDEGSRLIFVVRESLLELFLERYGVEAWEAMGLN